MATTYAPLSWNDASQFLSGVGMTLSVTLVSLLIGSVLGILLGLWYSSNNKIVSKIPLFFIEPLRNSPLVAQLFLVYYGFPVVFSIYLNNYMAGVLALSLNTAAFFAVLVKNSIRAIPNSQWEAAYALGCNKWQAVVHVIAVQVLRLLVPQWITLCISQLQCSSLIALVGLMDLTKVGLSINARSLNPFGVWGIVAVLYYVISAPLAVLASRLEKKVNYSY